MLMYTVKEYPPYPEMTVREFLQSNMYYPYCQTAKDTIQNNINLNRKS